MNMFVKLFRETLEPTKPAHPDALSLIQQRDQLFRENINLRAALIDVRNYTNKQKSGTAQKVHRMVKDALK